ncbi:MAG: hypothetical protein OXP69_06490 [Spirochaetaceae bacterium]|nr:hypothetical protein [Spirochaetaceae bacterium]
MRDPRLEQHRIDKRLQDASGAAARVADGKAMVAGLAKWCREVLFAADVLESGDRGNGLATFAAVLTTRYPDDAFRAILDPRQRQTLEASFRALIEGHDHPKRDVMGWLFGKALVDALGRDSERIRLLVPKLWRAIGYDFFLGSCFVDSLRELIRRSQSVRRVIIDLLESRVNDINEDPGIGTFLSQDREALSQAADAWRENPSIDTLKEFEFVNFDDEFLSMIPGLLTAARDEIVHCLDRLEFPLPMQQILFQSPVVHDREEIAALLEKAPPCSDDGRSWNHHPFALLVLQVVGDHCDALWGVECADSPDDTRPQVLEKVKRTLLPWIKQLGRIIMVRPDGQFLAAQWLFMKLGDERQQRTHLGFTRQSSDRRIPQADLIEWVAMGLAKAGLTTGSIADQVDFSKLPPGGEIAPGRPAPRDDSPDHRLGALLAMCLVDYANDNSCGDVERERLCLFDRLLASRHAGFERETHVGEGLDGMPARYLGSLMANRPNPSERWRQSWDLLVEQRRRVQHWTRTNDSDALAPSLFLLAVGVSAVAWLLSPPNSRSDEARVLWRSLFEGTRECWLTMTLSHLSESIEMHLQRLFCWHPMVYCELDIAQDTSETSTRCSEEYAQVLSQDLDFLGGDHLMVAICILNASRNGATPAIMNDVLKRNSDHIGTLITQFEQWQEVEREVRRRPDIVAELAELKASIATLT